MQISSAGTGISSAGTQTDRRFAARALRVVLALMWFALIAQCALAVTTTNISDTIYLADGSVASGSLLISWPTFTTAAGEAVPGGNKTVMVTNGALIVALAPTEGATPAGVFYTVSAHLNGAVVTTEYWVVPATGTATLGAIRSKLMPVTRAIPLNGGLASAAGLVQKAGDSMQGPLSLSGDPVAPTQASTKHYVDASVSSQQALIDAASAAAAAARATALAAVPKTGGTLTGTLTLAGDPAGNMDAATKQYVDGHVGGASLPQTSALLRGNGAGGGAVASRADVEATLGYLPLPASGTYDLNRDCGAVADFAGDPATATDNSAKVQACLDAHPGGNFAAANGSYYFSRDITLHVDGTLFGKGHSYNGQPAFSSQQTGTTFYFAPGSAGIHLQGGGNLYDINIVSGDGAPRQAVADQAARLVLPAGQYLPQWTEETITLTRTAGVVTASTLYGSWWRVDGIIAITGATPSSFNTPAVCIDTLTRPGTNSVLTWAQPGLPDETATVQATIMPATTGAKHGSGVIVEGAGEHVWNVDIANFSNSCFEVNPGPTDLFISDDTRFEDSYTEGCAVNGISVLGGEDTSKGSYHHINNNFNMLYGANFTSFLGDGIYDLQNSYNALNFSPPGGAVVAVSSCSIAGNVENCTTSAPHGFAVGNGIVQAGMSNAGLNTTRANTIECFVSATPDNTHYSCALPLTVANGSSTGGTARLASGDEFIRGFGGDTGHYSVGRHGLAAHNLGLALYAEGGAGTHTTDGCALRMNSGMLLIQPHLGDCISPDWMPSIIQSDGNYGLQLSGDQLTMNASAYHFKPSGNPALADIATLTKDGDFSMKGALYPGGRLGLALDSNYAFYIYDKASSRFALCVDTNDMATIFNYPTNNCAYHGGTHFQVYSNDANGDQDAATAGRDWRMTSGLSSYFSMVSHVANERSIRFGDDVYGNTLFDVDDASNFYFQVKPKSSFDTNTSAGGSTIWSVDAATHQMKMTAPFAFAGGGAISASTVYAPNIVPTGVAAQSCADETFTVPGLVSGDMLSELHPPAGLGNVSVNAYASAADTVTLHFCNVSVGSVTPVAGAYVFRATH